MMAAKLIRTETTYTIDITTKVEFTDEYDPDLYGCVPEVARAFFADGKLDKIELDGPDRDGFETMVMVRDHDRLTGHQMSVIRQILVACES